jgi:hypothetical protein
MDKIGPIHRVGNVFFGSSVLVQHLIKNTHKYFFEYLRKIAHKYHLKLLSAVHILITAIIVQYHRLNYTL